MRETGVDGSAVTDADYRLDARPAEPMSDFEGPSFGGGPGEPGRQPGILLVDDRAENLSALEAVLAPLGERLVTAQSGEEALRVLLREEIAVILLDVRMTGLDGPETAQIIRTRPRTRHIPIIFLTAQASEIDEISLAYASGAVDYVVKPFEPEILRAKVSVFVELNRERAERVRQSGALAHAEAVTRTVRTLQVLGDAALAHLELDGLVAELLERSEALFQASGAALLLHDETAPGLRLEASHGVPPPVPREGRLFIGEGILGGLAAERRAALLSLSDFSSESTSSAPPRTVAEGWATLLVVPLVTAEELLGLLLLGAPVERQLDLRDLELLSLAADRMAIAIDHVQRFSHGRQLVERLQRSLLPERLPRHPRLKFAARYLPSGLVPQIGGDWYDAIELDSDRTAVMIGDVVGHGIRAATTMSELRNALRAFAVEGHSPSAALHQLGRVVHATFGMRMIATVLFIVIDTTAETVTVARAGHPSPVLRHPDGVVQVLDSGNTLPLGVDERFMPDEAQYPIEPGATLLLFTDGLFERRDESISVGLRRLRVALASAPDDVEQICDHVLARTTSAQAAYDDIAIMAVRLLGYHSRALELTLPTVSGSVPLARHRLRAWLKANLPELDRLTQGELEVVFSEACTNAVRHAYGPREATFTAGATLQADAISLTVSDHGRWRPPRGEHGGRGLDLMRQLTDELSIDRHEDGTTVCMHRRLDVLASQLDGAAS